MEYEYLPYRSSGGQQCVRILGGGAVGGTPIDPPPLKLVHVKSYLEY
jgi:hypothetical protein